MPCPDDFAALLGFSLICLPVFLVFQMPLPDESAMCRFVPLTVRCWCTQHARCSPPGLLSFLLSLCLSLWWVRPPPCFVSQLRWLSPPHLLSPFICLTALLSFARLPKPLSFFVPCYLSPSVGGGVPLGLCLLCGCFRSLSLFCLQVCWLRWWCRVFIRFWFGSIYLSPEFSPCFPCCCLTLGGMVWGFCLLSVCRPNYLSLVCLRHLLTYCYLLLGVFVTHDNDVLCHVGAFCLGSTSLLWCNIVHILTHILQIYRSTQPQHFEIRGTR